MTTELYHLTLAEAARRIQARQLSPVELTEAVLRWIEAVNPQLDAFVTLLAERALADARQAEREIGAGRYRGPLHGIPIGLKDIFNTAGVLTSGHSRVMMHNVPREDAAATARLREAGAILVGKLASHEFAHGGPSFDLPWPPARNPWNREHFTGGSSSGSGAAVAAGFVLGALGSDTGGSIRTPAALSGVVGLKPTYGLVSRYGVITNSYTFDHVGPLAWTVEDAALLLQAIAGHDPRDPASVERPVPDYRAALAGGIEGLRIGVLRHTFEEELPVQAEMRAAIEAALDVFRGLGASVTDARIRPLQDYYDVKIAIAEAEMFAVHEANLRSRVGDFGEDFLGRCLPACLIRGPHYVQAQRERRAILGEMEALYARHDVLVTCGAAGPAPRLDAWRTIAFWQRPSLTTPFNVTGGPALTQCMGFSAAGLPLGLQIAGRPFGDATVLRVAHAYERATPWRQKRPPLAPGATFSRQLPPVPDPATAETTPAERDRIATVARRAGLTLSERHFEQLCASAPYVEAMLGRLRKERDWSLEPANVFSFPRGVV
jgi:aspartyl-tRNA(Asn)/glutamyl-tRNA(Gln) amidotransferase subunit A